MAKEISKALKDKQISFCLIALQTFYSIPYISDSGGSIGFDTECAINNSDEMISVFFYRSIPSDFIERLPRSSYRSYSVRPYGEKDVSMEFYI